METKSRGTWFDDAAHFQRTMRREFLYVGLISGLGLTLPEFFKLEAQAAIEHYETREGPAKSIIHIFLPGGHGPPGIVCSQAVRSG